MDNEIYVGSTTKTLKLRMQQHKSISQKSNCKLYIKVRELGVENFSIELLENVLYDNITELRIKEQHYIELLNPNLNKKNAKSEPIKILYLSNPELYLAKSKLYYQANKEKIIERVHLYSIENPEKIKANGIKYREEHKDEIKIRKQINYICECGKTSRLDKKCRHEKSKFHINNSKQNN